MDDIVIVGAGPAGAVAGALLARAGVRVRIVDRAAFPRDKLCGDTINPGALAMLDRLGLVGDIRARGIAVDGMIVSGDGVVIEGRYPRGLHGRALLRRDLDTVLLEQAMAAGCQFEPAVAARRVRLDDQRGTPVVVGVGVDAADGERTIPGRVTIAADGRRSTIAFGLGLAGHPARPRRWAVGGYFSGAGDVPGTEATEATLGEMHVRRNGYIGVARVPGGLTNVCIVRPSAPGDAALHDPAALLTRTLADDPMLRDRFADARLAAPPVVLGPLAVDVRPQSIDGLLLAGDAAGFIDPMTGDGLRFAICGGELAAAAALEALEHGWNGVHDRLAAARRRAFRSKWRFNRALRALVGAPHAISAAAVGARLAPGVLRAVIARAGDCDLATVAGYA